MTILGCFLNALIQCIVLPLDRIALRILRSGQIVMIIIGVFRRVAQRIHRFGNQTGGIVHRLRDAA